MSPFDRLQKANTIDNLWIYILSLAELRPIYAYELQKEIEKKFGFQSGKITPYRVLYRLENEGFVKSKLQERKRIYQITKKGEKELKKAKNFYRNLLLGLN
ncbi:MAG TPA: PadR family transcriptional regulator [Candidatus Pacearchaeota archaeon]|nr:PadR family transcriptional regulator [Candidatus Pacearchaeota archaeon]HOK93995.1 PadR family transcriptional regulator [Candidatus Pacearchaeota archaeon]HPO75066.1 PadR family transcriptional regulator [Candidatus Pacearchaeota archaeon]